MNFTARRERFRAILAGDACVNPASVYDPLSARIAQDLGYELAMLAGSIASLAVLGAPDLAVLTLTELAQQVMRISRAGNLPLLVDADHGYGNALNVMRTVEELETAGVACLSIEDTALPPSEARGTRLISIDEGVGKMRAAVAGRQDPSLSIAARTSAMSVAGIDEALARGRAYAACGVDAVFLVGVRTREELDAVASAIELPLIIGGVAAAIADPEYLRSRRVRVALLGHAPFMAAMRAAYNALKSLREGTPVSASETAPRDLVKQVSRDDDYQRWMRDYLGGGTRIK
jgi:carboxyvinyl-carboxyphosphonate phosphorylmutase